MSLRAVLNSSAAMHSSDLIRVPPSLPTLWNQSVASALPPAKRSALALMILTDLSVSGYCGRRFSVAQPRAASQKLFNAVIFQPRCFFL